MMITAASAYTENARVRLGPPYADRSSRLAPPGLRIPQRPGARRGNRPPLHQPVVLAGFPPREFEVDILDMLAGNDSSECPAAREVRGFIADRYAPLVEALYDGSSQRHVETEVTFEDGRKGSIAADVRIRDMKPVPVAPPLREAAE